MSPDLGDMRAEDVAAALRVLSQERRTHWDRRSEFQDWSEGVYKSIEATQEDIREVKLDIKKILADNATVNTAIALLKRDRDHAGARWEEVRGLLNEIKVNGCDVYRIHRAETIAAPPIVEAVTTGLERVGHTWPDLVSRFDKTNLGFLAVIAILMYFIMGGWTSFLALIGVG